MELKHQIQHGYAAKLSFKYSPMKIVTSSTMCDGSSMKYSAQTTCDQHWINFYRTELGIG